MLFWKIYALCALIVPTKAFALSPSLSRSTLSSSLLAATEEQSPQSRDERERSPWASSQWTFTLNFGREPGTFMPDDWGAEGGRLVFDLPIEVTSDRPSTDKVDSMLQRKGFQLKPLSDAKYVTMEGEQQCIFAPEGQWNIRLPSGKARGDAAKLMCYVDLKTSIRKKDIFLEKGERIYLTAKSWREEELERALIRLQPIQRNYLERQAKLEKALGHEDGDRRLDGTDPLQTALGMKDTARLVIDRDNALREYEDLNRVSPTIDDDSGSFPSPEDLEWPEGSWPGQVEWLTIEPLYMMVRRRKFLGEEYHVIGSWAATPPVEDE